MELTGTRVVVVGGTSGIGLATARLAAERGARVVATGRSVERIRRTASAAPGVELRRLDASDRDGSDELFAEVGPVDHLAIAASAGKGGGMFAGLDLEAVRAGFDGKFWPQLTTLQSSLSALAPTGSVVLVGSVSASTATPGTAGLAAINGALESIVAPLSLELAPVRVNAVAPGVIDTPWWDSFPEAERDAAFAARTPVGRIGRPEDVAHAICALFENDFITGVVLPVDGGLRLRGPG